MSKGSTKVQSPDPYEVAAADARYNRIDQYTPYGSLTFGGPDRNQATLAFNPAVADLANRQLLSDRMLLDTALSRQLDLQQGSLPQLTPGVNPGAYQEFFGVPSSLTSGFDAPISPPNVPDYLGGYQPQSQQPPGTVNAKGGPIGPGYGQPAPYQGASATPLRGFSPVGPGEVGSNAQRFADATTFRPSSPRGLKGGTQQPSQASPPQFDQGGVPIPPQTAPEAPQGDFFSSGPNRVEQAAFDRNMSLLQPQFDIQEERLLQDLANRGIPRDSEAGMRELDRFQRMRGEQLGRLSQDAIGQGFRMADVIGQRDIQSQLQNAQIAQSNRASQFNELAALLGLQQVAQPGLGNFFTPGQADVTGGFALQNQANMANAANSTALKGGVLGGLGDLGGAYIGRA